MSTIIASNVLANGLRTEFADTYTSIRNRQADGRLGAVMDLSIGATNRQHEFAYFEAAPHMEYWRRGDTVPSDAMGSVKFTAKVYEWARRVGWSKFDRKDDQTQSLMDAARMAGQSAALLPERFFFDLITETAGTLPAIGTAPDGANFWATTAGGANRFGVSGGNLLSGGGVGSATAILGDYYAAIEQFMQFQDGKGQPLLSPEIIAQGVICIHPASETQVFETAFMQKLQGLAIGVSGGASISNIVSDASRNVELWSSPRLSGQDWYIFLKNPPKKATFLLNREGVQEFSSLEGDNNSDHTRNTGLEYVQWETRQGAAIALPYGAIKINN